MNTINKNILSMTLIAGSLAFSAGAQASFTIDTFSVGTSPILINAPGTQTNTINSDFSVLREGSITYNGGTGGANYAVTGGRLAISDGVDAQSDTKLKYANAAGFDFTAAETGGGSIFNSFFLELLEIDQGGVQITLTVDTVSVTKSITSAGNVLFAHSLFVGVDMTSVNSITYDIHNNDAVDATFDSFGSFGGRTQVPEPTAIALLGMGLVAFGFGRRKAK